MRQSAVIEKDAIATLPRSLLKRQGDQVAETALRKRVLVGEETVVRIKPDARPAFHRFGQEVRAELARQRGRNRLLEEEPDVPAIARTRTLESRRQIQTTTGFEERSRVLLPLRLIQIGRQEEAGLIPEHRVNAHDEVAPGVVMAGKMPAYHLIRHGQEMLIRASGAFDPGLLAQAPRSIRCHTRVHIPTCPSCRFSKRRG